MSDLTICTPVHGDPHIKCLPYWEESIKRVMPDADTYVYRYNPSDFPGYEAPGYTGDHAKMKLTEMLCGDRHPILVTDVDVLFKKPFEYEPSSDKIDLAILGVCPVGEDNAPFNFYVADAVRDANLEQNPDIEVASWAFWTRTNLLPYWDKWLPLVRVHQNLVGKANIPVTIVLFSLIFYDLRKEGRAEVLPQARSETDERFWKVIQHVHVVPWEQRIEVMEEMFEEIKQGIEPVNLSERFLRLEDSS